MQNGTFKFLRGYKFNYTQADLIRRVILASNAIATASRERGNYVIVSEYASDIINEMGLPSPWNIYIEPNEEV